MLNIFKKRESYEVFKLNKLIKTNNEHYIKILEEIEIKRQLYLESSDLKYISIIGFKIKDELHRLQTKCSSK